MRHASAGGERSERKQRMCPSSEYAQLTGAGRANGRGGGSGGVHGNRREGHETRSPQERGGPCQ